jgi:hypothetical protein
VNEDREHASGSLKMTASHCPSADTVMSVGVPGREIDLLNAPPWPSLKNMETASRRILRIPQVSRALNQPARCVGRLGFDAAHRSDSLS